MNSVVISLDVELGWGFHDLDTLPAERIDTARTNWRRLLALFDDYEIPTTWAIVGHLLEVDCDRPHPDHPAGERCCTRTTDSLSAERLWYGESVVDLVRNATVDHELASHGYTHVHFQHEAMHPAFAERELAASIAASEAHGVSPDTFVFPVNRIDHRDRLADAGFTAYRGTAPARHSGPRKVADALLGRGTPPIAVPEMDEYGLVNVPASLNLFAFEGLARSLLEPIRGDPVAGRVQRGLDQWGDRDGILHLWFHPHDLTRERKFERLRSVLAAVCRARDRGELTVETMGQVAARVAGGDRASNAESGSAAEVSR